MSRFVILILVLALWVVAEVWLWMLLKTAFQPKSWSFRLFTLLWFGASFTTLAILVFRPESPSFSYRLLGQLVMLITISKVLALIFTTLGMGLWEMKSWVWKSGVGDESRRVFLRKVAIFSGGIPLVTTLYGLFRTASQFRIHQVTLRNPKIPQAFAGFRIVQISDIHTGSVLFPETMEKAVKTIQELKPDLIVFTGDLVNNFAAEAEPFVPLFSQLKAPHGVFSILGNHDYGDYHMWPNDEARLANFEQMLRLHQRMGWHLLMNASVALEKEGSAIQLAGVENWGAKVHFKRYGKIEQALAGLSPEKFTLLLSHDPSHWQAEVVKQTFPVDLMLAGHTHGFQFGVEIPGFKWSPSQYVYDQWAGLYSDGDKKLYVNRGTGCIGYSGRVGIPPEITLITLQPA